MLSSASQRIIAIPFPIFIDNHTTAIKNRIDNCGIVSNKEEATAIKITARINFLIVFSFLITVNGFGFTRSRFT
jgi:hypothetical protein